MSRSCGPVAEVVRQTIGADQTLIDVLGGQRVYGEENLPGIEAFDFITIGSADSKTYERFMIGGEDIGLAIHIWSKIVPTLQATTPAKRRVYGIAAYISRALHNKKLSVPGFGVVMIGQVYLTSIVQDPASVYVHGIMRYEALVSYDRNAEIVL